MIFLKGNDKRRGPITSTFVPLLLLYDVFSYISVTTRLWYYVLSRIPIPFIILIKINMILFFVLSPFTNYLVPIARIVAAFIVTRITPGAFISLRSILSSLSVSFASGAHVAELRMPCFLILSSLINISRWSIPCTFFATFSPAFTFLIVERQIAWYSFKEKCAN